MNFLRNNSFSLKNQPTLLYFIMYCTAQYHIFAYFCMYKLLFAQNIRFFDNSPKIFAISKPISISTQKIQYFVHDIVWVWTKK